MDIIKIVEDLIDPFLKAGELSISLREKGLKKEIKSDNTPVSNGDFEVNKFITKKISEITPDIPIISEEASDNKDKTQGNMPLGLSKEVEVFLEPEVDWRHALWKYVGKTPVDFDDLDRRFLYRGLYLEGLLTEALEVSVCIDTSGSVSQKLLDQFLGELKGILNAYPHVRCDLFFADTEIRFGLLIVLAMTALLSFKQLNQVDLYSNSSDSLESIIQFIWGNFIFRCAN